MKTGEPNPSPPAPTTSGGRSAPARPDARFTLTLRHLRGYQTADAFSGILIYGMIIFSPWAFGTTQRWSAWVMNAAAFGLALLLLGKWYLRWRHGYRPPRWGTPSPEQSGGGRWLVGTLAGLTGLILAFCLVSALNVRATYQEARYAFEYHDYLKWLPHSYDGPRTWREMSLE